MDIVNDLIKERERREAIFENYERYVMEIKEIAKRYFGDVKVYIFGSVVRGDYHVMLSNIDIAVITDYKNRERILKFEVLDEKRWRIYRKFIDCLKEI